MLKYQRIKVIVAFLYTLKILDGCYCFVSTYGQLPPCGHLAITDTSIIRRATRPPTIHVIPELLHFAFIALCVRKVLIFCVEKFLHFESMLLHFAAIFVTFCVGITFCGVTVAYIRNLW